MRNAVFLSANAVEAGKEADEDDQYDEKENYDDHCGHSKVHSKAVCSLLAFINTNTKRKEKLDNFKEGLKTSIELPFCFVARMYPLLELKTISI